MWSLRPLPLGVSLYSMHAPWVITTVNWFHNQKKHITFVNQPATTIEICYTNIYMTFWVNDRAFTIVWLITVTLDTSHLPVYPQGSVISILKEVVLMHVFLKVSHAGDAWRITHHMTHKTSHNASHVTWCITHQMVRDTSRLLPLMVGRVLSYDTSMMALREASRCCLRVLSRAPSRRKPVEIMSWGMGRSGSVLSISSNAPSAWARRYWARTKKVPSIETPITERSMTFW